MSAAASGGPGVMTQRVASLSAAWISVAAAMAVSALFGTIGADARWLAAIGAYISRHGSIPDFVPYATAPSHGWHNVPVLGELAFHGLDSLGGDTGLYVAQVLAVALAFSLLSLDMRAAGASDAPAGWILLLLIPAVFPAIPVARAQLFSFALFPLLVLVLRRETRRPSPWIWLVPAIVALWSNLHGGVLVGLGVAAIYLVAERARLQPVVAGAVLVASVVAVFATPALWRSGSYYRGVLENEAAKRGVGLWSPLSLSSGFDIVFLVCALGLVVALARRRPRLWELAALVALAVLTVRTARGGVWFALLAATPAAVGLGRRASPRARVVVPAVAALVAFVGLGLARGPHQSAAGVRVLDRALAEAAGTPILATDLLAEQVAVRGGKVWIGNPIDAFEHRDQGLWLDWLDGKPRGDAALRTAPRVVLVRPHSPPDKRLARRDDFRKVAHDGGAVLYVRR
jgi:hypothetical protein